MSAVEKFQLYPWRLWTRQISTIVRMELRKSLFRWRSAWIYLLAFAPVAIIGAHALIDRHNGDGGMRGQAGRGSAARPGPRRRLSRVPRRTYSVPGGTCATWASFPPRRERPARSRTWRRAPTWPRGCSSSANQGGSR